MTRTNLVIVIALLAAILFFALWQYVFSIYEVTYRKSTDVLYADGRSEVTVSSVPINAFGWKAPLRSAPAVFKIREGSELCEILFSDEKNGIIRLRSGIRTGLIVLEVKSEFSLLPTIIEIPVIANIV